MTDKALKLGVNIDHVATLRQVRRAAYPDVLEAARLCEEAGAEGITVHLREDRRHIQDHDVIRLRESLRVGMNLEMAAAAAIVEIACRIRPAEACLVPERREELTTEGGLDVAGNAARIKDVTAQLKDAGIVVSLFIAADDRQIDAACAAGAPCIEIHTGHFCDATAPDDRRRKLEQLVRGAAYAHQRGLQVNAGHGINLDNIRDILTMPFLDTLNIGHSIIARAVIVGLKNAVMEMRQAMIPYRGGKTSVQ
jgi:pyridoxine 5-phosphate synthase